MKKSTDELIQILKNKSDLNDYLKENTENISDASLVQMLNSILKNNGITKSEAIDNSFIQKNYAYQIFNGTKTPSRDKLIMLSIGIGATVEQTKALLLSVKAAPLYPKDERDSIILFGILHKISIIDINILLYEHGHKILE